MKELNKEKKKRFESGDHLTYTKLHENINWRTLLDNHPFPCDTETVPPQAFQDVPEALTEGDTFQQVIRGYRVYYRREKKDMSEWRHTQTPEFMKGL